MDSTIRTDRYSYTASDYTITRLPPGGSHSGTRSRKIRSAGKWFFCVSLVSETLNDGLVVGFATASDLLSSYPGANTTSWGCQFNRAAGPVKIFNNNFENISGAVVCGNGDVAMIAVDIDAGKIWFGRNGTWWESGSPETGANPTLTFTSGTSLHVALSEAYQAVRTVHLLAAGAPLSAPAGFTPWDT